MNYDEMYYHGLSGDIDNNVKLQVEKSLARLESILKSGGLLSKSMLIQNGLNDYIGKPVFNGDDYISLCIKYFPLEELEGINEGLDSSYDKYVENCLSIVIDKSIENNCSFRIGEYSRLPGERQVKDKVDISNFKAIMIGFEDPILKSIVAEMVNDILSKYGVELPIIDNDYNLLINNNKIL